MLKLLKRVPKSLIILSVFFAFMQGITELLLPTLTARLINDGVAQGNFDAIWGIAGQMFIMTLLIVGSALANIWFASKASQGLGRDLRNALYAKVQRLSKDTYDEFGNASLITRSSSDIVQIELTTMMVLRMFLLSPAMLIASITMAYQASPQMSQTYLATIPIIAIAIGIVIYTASPLFRSMQKKVDRMNLIFREGLTGVRVIRAFNKNAYESDRFQEANDDYRQTAIGAQVRLAFLIPVMMTTLNLTTVFLVWYGGRLTAIQSLDMGVILSFISYTAIMGVSFMFIGLMFVLIPRAQVSAERVNQVLEAPKKIHSPENGGQVLSLDEAGQIDFNHVHFAYDGAESNVLDDIDFHLTPGMTLGIIGGTGSGKSTIANLLLRFYDRSSGEIRINGHLLEDINLNSLRRYIAYVPQKANLFRGTIRSNMLAGKSDATDEEIWRALEIAQAADFVSSFSDQLDRRVEQGGSNFSGGQKQRLCIARALIKQSPVNVFDDSFSALDAKTDANLRQALKNLDDQTINLIIAQRVSTISDADLIIVLNDNGSIAGTGSHESLQEDTPIYRSIVQSQLKEVSD
ncbi:multidrug ABC transporter ATP-binding protein [Aerococcus sp. HMSC035B07]|uniref:ABC transporter ATP-binding protein n=1 Tax=Aerococcus sp. HMSC035B07 TaxID=1715184 RepID=UPI0008AA1B26|nr:ABC transporter ATP-binding protein [Aerococcus sp. HMSC035B07]OHO43532.1 multidrug ABC transporter ATP-binding protein [Aerococcus sp. HMSC035B07]